MQESKSMRKRLAEWSKTPEGRESYEKVAEEMRNEIAITNNPEESEKPINQDELEKEINRYLEPIHAADIQFEPFTQMTKCARHFAQWGYLRAVDKYDEIEYNKQRAEESVPKDLEEAANEFANQDCVTFISRKNGFIAGAKWRAKRMKDEKEKE